MRMRCHCNINNRRACKDGPQQLNQTARLVLVGLQGTAVVFFQCGTRSVLKWLFCLVRTQN